jgi:hypothetical protein
MIYFAFENEIKKSYALLNSLNFLSDLVSLLIWNSNYFVWLFVMDLSYFYFVINTHEMCIIKDSLQAQCPKLNAKYEFSFEISSKITNE